MDSGTTSPDVVPVVSFVVASLLMGAGASLSAAPLVVAMGLLADFGPWARLALRKSPPNPPDFLPSPSVPSASDTPPVLFSFLVPKLLKKDERRLALAVSGDTGEVVGVVAGAVSVVAAGAFVSSVGAVSVAETSG